MKKIIIYIHGFNSSGFANKANQLKEYFGDAAIYNPSYFIYYFKIKLSLNIFWNSFPNNPKLALLSIESTIALLAPHYDISLLGSSLGKLQL